MRPGTPDQEFREDSQTNRLFLRFLAVALQGVGDYGTRLGCEGSEEIFRIASPSLTS
jgi:hypothetical protein